MGSISKKLNKLIDSWKEYKGAELDWQDGLIDSNTLFECEWSHYEHEQELINTIELEIIKDEY
jgi:hypothetical protein